MIIRLLIALLLLAAVPAMAAEDKTPAAPPLAQQQVRDTLLEQLQRQVGEAQTRADEAERRERDAEIKRLADQARQAQTGQGQAEQRARDAEQQLLILQKISEQGNDAYARFEIIVSVSIGFFASLITVLVVFFALRTEKTAVAEAVKEAVKGVGDEIKTRLTEVNAIVAKIRDHETRAGEIVRNLSSGKEPESEEDRKTIADVAREAAAKSPRDRTANEFRAIIIDLLTQEKWADMLTAAQQMRLLHEGDDDFGFARFNEAYALGQLERSEEAIDVYDDMIARHGASEVPGMQERVASALVNKGVRLMSLGKSEEAIGVYDDMIARYGGSEAPGVRERVASAHVNKGAALGQLGQVMEAIAVFDVVIVRHGTSEAPGMLEQVTNAHINKGVMLGKMGQAEEEMATYDRVIGLYGQSKWPEIRKVVRSAYFNKACVYARTGSVDEAITVLQAMLKAGHPLDLKQIADDADFDPIRNDPAFKKFLDENKG